MPTFPNVELATPVSATNWPTRHYRNGDGRKVQIADFMIVSRRFSERTAGVFDRYGGGVWAMDPDNRNLEAWMGTTDHAPVGGMFSTTPDDPQVNQVRRQAQDSAFPKLLRDRAKCPSATAEFAGQGKHSELGVSTKDEVFFLSRSEMGRVPEGHYNLCTHDIARMAGEILNALPKARRPTAEALERTLGRHGTIGGALAELQGGLPMENALAAAWRASRRYDEHGEERF